MLGALDEADHKQIDKEIEIDLLHDIEQIVENYQVEDVTQQQQHVDDDDEPMVDYDDELASEIRETEAKIEELKA